MVCWCISRHPLEITLSVCPSTILMGYNNLNFIWPNDLILVDIGWIEERRLPFVFDDFQMIQSRVMGRYFQYMDTIPMLHDNPSFLFLLLTNLTTLGVPDKSYSRNVSCTYFISTFLFRKPLWPPSEHMMYSRDFLY